MKQHMKLVLRYCDTMLVSTVFMVLHIKLKEDKDV